MLRLETSGQPSKEDWMPQTLVFCDPGLLPVMKWPLSRLGGVCIYLKRLLVSLCFLARLTINNKVQDPTNGEAAQVGFEGRSF